MASIWYVYWQARVFGESSDISHGLTAEERVMFVTPAEYTRKSCYYGTLASAIE